MKNNKLRLWAMHHPIKAAYCWSFIVLIFVVNLNISGLLLDFIFILMTIIWISTDVQSQLAAKKRAINIPNNSYRNQIDFRIPLYLNSTFFAYLAIGSFVEGNVLIGICLLLIAICSFIPFNYQDDEYNNMVKQLGKLNERKEENYIPVDPDTVNVNITNSSKSDIPIKSSNDEESKEKHSKDNEIIKKHAEIVNSTVNSNSKDKRRSPCSSLFQNRHFYPDPLEGNVSLETLNYFNNKINDANNSTPNDAIRIVLSIPDHLKGHDKKFVNNFITNAMFHSPITISNPHFNNLVSYDFYYWKIVSTNQVFFIEMVINGKEPTLCEKDIFYRERLNFIYNKYQTVPILLESSVPGPLAETELASICDIVEANGNLLLNKGYGYEGDYYFNQNKHMVINPDNNYNFLTRPKHLVTLFDYLYNNQTRSQNKWDNPEKQILKESGIGNNKYAIRILCKKDTKKNRNLYDQRLNKLKSMVTSIIRGQLHGHIYKSVGKRPTCVIVFTDINDSEFSEYKKRGLAVYHAFDILKLFGNWDTFVNFCNSKN